MATKIRAMWHPEPEADCGICIDELPFCCGIKVFGEAVFHGDAAGYPSAFRKDLERNLETRSGLILYSIADGQEHHEMLKAGLKKAGFREYERFRNPNTGRMITLYGRLTTRRKK